MAASDLRCVGDHRRAREAATQEATELEAATQAALAELHDDDSSDGDDDDRREKNEKKKKKHKDKK